jgi:hypothetical protein
MNIQLNGIWNYVSYALPSMNSRVKPLIYVISALAVAILIYQCYFDRKNTPLLERDVKVVSPKEEVQVEQSRMTFQQLVENSREFASHTSFPTHDNLIENFATNAQLQAEVVEHASTTHPVLHSRIWSFVPKFLDDKRKYGSAVEKQFYREMTPTQLVDRLIKKRPLVFWNPSDAYLLRNGQEGAGGFELIGTDQEQGDLRLENYQSYSEMRLAAFLSCFVPTHFINNGSRNNEGVLAPQGTYEAKGIYVGMVGARFERPGLMEWAHMVVTLDQNTPVNGYGKDANPADPKTIELRLWAELYQSRLGDVYALPDYEEAKADQTGRYLSIHGDAFLDTFVYKERLKLVLESFLLESNERAMQQGKKAYLHIVGLGLGVWMLDPRQTDLMLEVYTDLLRQHQLEHISDIDFSWFKGSQKLGGVSDQGTFDSHGHSIKVHFSKRNPADKLIEEDAGKLLIAQYAWDSNSYPGNEYWLGALSASGDPAAACSSMIPELQNPEINPNMQAEFLTLR